MNIGAVIAEARERNALSQTELAARLTMLGVNVTNQAVSKWENNQTLPNAQQLIVLCAALGIYDPVGEFTNGRAGCYKGLNSDGRRKLEEYHRLLLESGRYALREERDRARRMLPLYSIAVSAGTGQFLDGENYEMVEVGREVPEGANFGVRVAGDSMEPRYHDGQTVWVRQQRSLMTGETGIFLYDSCAYLKQLKAGKDCMLLHSLNSRYPDIAVSPELPLRVLGKVLN
ncbi:MAG: XRE family transcriptional regulator [Eubacteriales bacterium]|nr:XRE family transcriptional regulator [Eubacteriales bacterium]